MIYRRIRWIIFSPFLYSAMVSDSFPIFLSLYIIRTRQKLPMTHRCKAHFGWRNTFCGSCIKYWFEVYIIICKKRLRRESAWNQMKTNGKLKKFVHILLVVLFCFSIFLGHKICLVMLVFLLRGYLFCNPQNILKNSNSNVINLNFNHLFLLFIHR